MKSIALLGVTVGPAIPSLRYSAATRDGVPVAQIMTFSLMRRASRAGAAPVVCRAADD